MAFLARGISIFLTSLSISTPHNTLCQTEDQAHFLFIFKIEVMVSIFIGHTLWQDSALEHPAPKWVLYSLVNEGALSADWLTIR